MMLGYDFPWLLNGQNQINGNVNGGFRDAQLHDSITSVQSAISALATQLCQCCGDMRYDMSNGFNGVNNSIFGAQTALHSLKKLKRIYKQTATVELYTVLNNN